MTMSARSTKVLVAALVLGATSLAFVADASARPGQGGYQGGGYQGGTEYYMRERSDPTNTNGNG
jgi:hypothetical protein